MDRGKKSWHEVEMRGQTNEGYIEIDKDNSKAGRLRSRNGLSQGDLLLPLSWKVRRETRGENEKNKGGKMKAQVQ